MDTIEAEEKDSVIQKPDKKTSFLDLINPLKKKTGEEATKAIVIWLLITFLIHFLSNLSGLFIQISNLGNIGSDLVIYFLPKFIYIFSLILFYCKKKIGWILLCVNFIFAVGTTAISLTLAEIWIIKTILSFRFDLFEIFNFKTLFGNFIELLFNVVFLILLFKENIFEVFKIKRKTEVLIIGISILFIILWTTFSLKKSFQDENGPRKYLPIEYYNRFDVDDINNSYFIIKTKRKDVEKIFYRAEELRKKNNFPEAIQFFKIAHKLEPNNTDILFALSCTYGQNNELRKAIQTLDKAVLLDSTNSYFYNNRGLMYYKLKENDKALKDFNKEDQLDSTSFHAYLNLALVYYYKQMHKESIESIEKAEKFGADKQTLIRYKDVIDYDIWKANQAPQKYDFDKIPR